MIPDVHTPRAATSRRHRIIGAARRPLGIIVLTAAMLLVAAAAAGVFLPEDPSPTATATVSPVPPTAPPPAPPRRMAYGIDVTDCRLVTEQVRRHQNLGDILGEYGIGYGAVMDLAHKATDVFNVRRLRPNRPYCLVIPPAADNAPPSHFIYEISEEEYVVFGLCPPRSVTRGRKTVRTTPRTLAGTVETSLWQSMVEAGGDPGLIAALSEIYAWSVDFHYLKPGDTYRVVFEERWIDGRSIGMGNVLAAAVTHGGAEHVAYRFDGPERTGYFDENGRSLEKAFLKSPVTYNRISSRFSRQRFHPVLKRMKAHLGTDYAAPVGTPVMSTGDGTVMTAGYNRNNGNYVKIRHNGTYATQYLHLSRFANGIRKGAPVKQGDVIGYVGATGMATGPHLCYRFWKNGRQIDPLNHPMPPSSNLAPEHMAAFEKTVSQLRAMLDGDAGKMTLAQQQKGTTD